MLETIREFGGEQLEDRWRSRADPAAARRLVPGPGRARPRPRWRARTRPPGWPGSTTSTTTCGPRSAGRAVRTTGRPRCGWPARSAGTGPSAVTCPRAAGGAPWRSRSRRARGRIRRSVRVNCLVAAGRLAIGQAAYGEAEAVARRGGGAGPRARRSGRAGRGAQHAGAAGPVAEPVRRLGGGLRGGAAGWPVRPATAARRRRRCSAWPTWPCSPATWTGPARSPSRAWPRRGRRRTGSSWPRRCSSWAGAPVTPARTSGPRALVTEALDLFAELGETGEHAEALFVLGTVAMYSGDYRGAVGIFEQSLAERRGRGDEHTAARHLGGLGTALLNLGDLARARAVLEESLVVARRFDDQWYLGHVADAARPPAAGRGRPGPRPGRADRVGRLVHLDRQRGLPDLVPGGPGRGGGGGTPVRPGRGDRRRPRRAARPDRRAAAAGAPRRVRADAGGRAGQPR